MLDMLLDARVRRLGLTRGTAEIGKETALTKGYLRRRLSLATIKANVSCLLERLIQVEERGGQGGKRRIWARQEEERARLDRESQWLSKITGDRRIKTGLFAV